MAFAPRRPEDERTPGEQLLLTLTQPVHVTSVTLTAGLVWWITRSGGVLASAVMGVPVWRHVDLLPVAVVDDADDDEPMDEVTPKSRDHGKETEDPAEVADDEVEALFERG